MKYFGTDGIRGRVGQFPMTAEFVLQFGWAVGTVLCKEEGHRRVVIGKDTRISGYVFESALEAGLSAAGADSLLLGPLPTPGVAHLIQELKADAGIVISASHNPFHDNGLKLFSSDGQKLDDALQLAIEEKLEEGLTRGLTMVEPKDLGKAVRIDDAIDRYARFCQKTVETDLSLSGLNIILDCANGATYRVAPQVFRSFGSQVRCLFDSPDGLNINRHCGSTHPQSLAEVVRSEGADLGLAFDGDGDRVIMVDERGEIVDGDRVLYILASAARANNRLNGGVVGTVMSNLGLAQALEELGIPFERAAVGDRYVHERLTALNWSLGGEASGHILSLDRSGTGCGLITALQVCEIMQQTGQSLSELSHGLEIYPQTMINVPVSERVESDTAWAGPVCDAVQEAEAQLGQFGRVVLRPSGTEPVVRVMIEGADQALVESLAKRLADVVANHL